MPAGGGKAGGGEPRGKQILGEAHPAVVELFAEEIDLVAGGLAIGSSLVSPGSLVAYCTEKTCHETGGARLNPGDLVINPIIREPGGG